MANHLLRLTIFSITLLASAVLTNAQPTNLLHNPDAELGTRGWRIYDQATVEKNVDGNPCFVVRNGGYFTQDVNLPPDANGRYALLTARAASERVNADGAITGLPSLYGYMLDAGEPRGGRVLDYLQGQNMLVTNVKKDEWINLWGIFRVPEGTGRIRLFLSQALRKGVPHNGSAARFDDVGLYLFAKKEQAQSFVDGRA